MPASNSRSHRFVRLPGPGWTRVVVAGVVVTVAVTVLAVSIMASGRDGGADTAATEPKADNQSSSTVEAPRGQGGVEDKKTKSKKPKDGDKDSGGSEDGGDSGGGGDRSKYPGSGTYQIRSAVGGYCVGVGPEEGNSRKDVFVLDSCGSASPATKLVKTGSHTYQVTVHDSVNGTGCMAVDAPGNGDGYLAVPTGCNGSDLQSFTLERAGGGFQIVVDGTGKCVAPLEGEAYRGRALATLGCGGGKVETFTFE